MIVGYDTAARRRFVDPAHLPWFWTQANGLFSCVVLHNRRLRGSWRFTGPAHRRRIEVRMFPGEPMLAEADLADQVTAIGTVLAITIADLEITSAGGSAPIEAGG